jgi:serine/threonine protein kinase
MVVGKGTFAKVMLVQKIDTGRLYAMKVINKDAVIQHNAVKHTLSERNILKKINHPFIVSLKYSFQVLTSFRFFSPSYSVKIRVCFCDKPKSLEMTENDIKLEEILIQCN